MQQVCPGTPMEFDPRVLEPVLDADPLDGISGIGVQQYREVRPEVFCGPAGP